MARNLNKREEEFSLEENRQLKRVKSEDFEDTVEIEEEVQEPLPARIAPKYVDQLRDQFDGEGIPDREQRTRFFRDLGSIEYLHRRNESLGVLHSLEEAFLDSFQAYVIGYADPFEEL